MLKYLFLILQILGTVVYSKTIVVGKDKDFNTINSAVKVASAFDTIEVQSGIYREHTLLITKPLVIIGKNQPTIDGENKFEVVSIKSNFVILSGFRIARSGYASISDPAGIKVYNADHVIVENNIIDDTFFGIYLQLCRNCIIRNNHLTAHALAEQEIGNGIHCWKSDSLQIIANKIIGHRDGIYFEFVTNSIIWRNISNRNKRYGLHFMFSHNDAYIANVFKHNGAGVSVMFTHGVKMFNNTFSENWGDASYGILIKEISDSYVEGNIFTKNTMAIFMEGASRIVLAKNVFKTNGWAIKIQASSMDVNVTSNNFIGNTFDVTTNGSLVLNTFNGNYWDKFEGYDLNRDRIGDIPYHPISLYSMIVEKNPPAMVLFRSIIVDLIDKSERVIPSLTPDNLVDNKPLMKALPL